MQIDSARRTVPWPHGGRPWQRTGDAPNAHVAVDVDGAAFIELLCSRIGSLP